MAISPREEFKQLGKGVGIPLPHKRYSASERVAEGDMVRLAFSGSPVCNSVERVKTSQNGKVNPGSENRLDLACAQQSTYSDHRMFWLVFWVNRTEFEDLNPLRAKRGSVLVLPDSLLASDIIEGRK